MTPPPHTGGWHPIREPGGPPPRRVAASLDAVTRNLGGRGGPALVDLLQRWDAVVGEQLAAHSRPLALRDGALTIGVDDPAWGAQVGWLEADVLRRLADALGPGVVTRIAVRVRPR
ncbi:MAG: DUF721 domain-containing protein [Actinomycetota bacterium]|nr:DUF721 domain-containing protein [Actinomycetota bacterium]